MFKKLFNKKSEKTLEVKNDWASYFCRVENKPASIRLNLALNEIAPIEKYNNRVWFSIKLLNPDENGLTTKEEFPAICKIEDDISEALERIGMILVGALKTNGTFDLYFYSKSIGEFEEIVNTVMKSYSNYNYATDSKTDNEWNDYFDFLYPGEYEYQTILNKRVLINLEKQGDNAESEREVDHWLYFEKEGDRNNYILKIEKIGYKVLSENIMDEGKYSYQLNISKVNNTNTINDIVWELITLSKEDNGIYDGWGCPIAE
ncbi:DUF695 domain-containing protein [Tenacibaculum dicentrarchi]|nr:DUF695 domain-containing protein [Tenacibaculum dicentrarchi]